MQNFLIYSFLEAIPPALEVSNKYPHFMDRQTEVWLDSLPKAHNYRGPLLGLETRSCSSSSTRGLNFCQKREMASASRGSQPGCMLDHTQVWLDVAKHMRLGAPTQIHSTRISGCGAWAPGFLEFSRWLQCAKPQSFC